MELINGDWEGNDLIERKRISIGKRDGTGMAKTTEVIAAAGATMNRSPTDTEAKDIAG